MYAEINHGTYGGYQDCVHRLEGACQECKDAAAEYQREYRRKNPSYREQNLSQGRLRSKALHILKERHLSEYQAILSRLKREKQP